MRTVLFLKCSSLLFVALGKKSTMMAGTGWLHPPETHKPSFPTSKALALAAPYQDDFADLISMQRAKVSNKICAPAFSGKRTTDMIPFTPPQPKPIQSPSHLVFEHQLESP